MTCKWIRITTVQVSCVHKCYAVTEELSQFMHIANWLSKIQSKTALQTDKNSHRGKIMMINYQS
jgi:hypothetical protein